MAGASDIRAGDAYYEVGGKDKLTPVLDRIQKRAAQFGAFMQRIGKVSALAGAGLAAPLVALFKGGSDRAADLARLSLQLGLPIETLHKLQYAADAAGVSLDEVMNDWQGRYSSLVARAPAIDPNDARAAAQAQLELSDATRSVQLALLPLVKTVAVYVAKFSEFVRNNAGTARTVLAVGAGLIALGVTLKLLGIAFAGVIPLATAAWAAITGPIGLGIAAGAVLGGGLFLGLAYLADGFKLLKSTAATTGAVIGTTFGGIRDALAKADFALAWKIALVGMRVGWLEFRDFLETMWAGLKITWIDTTAGIATAASDVGHRIEQAFAAASITAGNWLKGLARVAVDVALKAAEAMDKLDPTDSLKGAIETAKRLKAELLEPGNVDKALSAIEDRRQGMEGIIKQNAQRDKADAFAGVVDARAQLEEAKAALAALRAEAAKPGAGQKSPFDQQTPLKNGLLGAVSVKGSFSGTALGQQLGVADQAVKQTELLKNLVDGKGELPDQIAAKLAPIVTGGYTVK